MKPNSFRPIRNGVRLRRNDFHRRRERWTTQWQAASPSKGGISLPVGRLSVPKIKEVLRLKFDVGLGLRQIARSCSIGLGTAHEYLQRAEAANITWPLGPEWDDDRLEAALFGGPPRSRPMVLAMPDFADLHRQRQQHSHLTQQLLWEEYRQENPDGYQYSRYVAAVFMLRNHLDAMTDACSGDVDAT